MSPRGAERLVRAARAAQALSETLWEALHEELCRSRAPSGASAELSERLADVSATVALLARADPGSGAAAPEAPMPPVESERPAERVDRRAVARTALRLQRRESRASVVRTGTSPVAGRDRRRAGARREPPEIEIRDERGEHDAAVWIASIARLLERYERATGLPFAVLLVELRRRRAPAPRGAARRGGAPRPVWSRPRSSASCVPPIR